MQVFGLSLVFGAGIRILSCEDIHKTEFSLYTLGKISGKLVNILYKESVHNESHIATFL